MQPELKTWKYSHLIVGDFVKNECSNETCFPFKLLDCDNNWEVWTEVQSSAPKRMYTVHSAQWICVQQMWAIVKFIDLLHARSVFILLNFPFKWKCKTISNLLPPCVSYVQSHLMHTVWVWSTFHTLYITREMIWFLQLFVRLSDSHTCRKCIVEKRINKEL